MKKIFYALTAITLGLAISPVWACSSDKAEVETGSACSIAELNNLEKERNLQDESSSLKQKDLRPVSLNPKAQKTDELFGDCLFGMCLRKKILEK